MPDPITHIHRGHCSVRPYLCGPTSLTDFIQGTFGAEIVEVNDGGPTLMKIGDSLLWVEAGPLPEHVKPWVGSVYVYVASVDSVYSRAMELGAQSVSAPEDKPYLERQAGFIDAGGNTWWVSTYLGNSNSATGE